LPKIGGFNNNNNNNNNNIYKYIYEKTKNIDDFSKLSYNG
jgi:hypothetical protein